VLRNSVDQALYITEYIFAEKLFLPLPAEDGKMLEVKKVVRVSSQGLPDVVRALEGERLQAIPRGIRVENEFQF